VKPASFEYHAPKSADEAMGLLAELGEGAKILAGGQSLVPMLALRLAVFDHLVDIGKVDELKGIAREDGVLSVGAATTEAAIDRSDEVASAVPLLARATPLIGHFQIRNRGTVGGSIAHADPAAEYPAVALALDAKIETLSVKGRETVAAADFFTGLWSTSLDPEAIVTGVRFPIWTGRCGFAINEFARRHGDFAIAGAAVAVELDGDDRVKRCAIGLIGLGSTPLRATEAEQELTQHNAGEHPADDVGRLAVERLTDVPSDLQGSAEYRRRVGAAVVADAWTAAVREAKEAQRG